MHAHKIYPFGVLVIGFSICKIYILSAVLEKLLKLFQIEFQKMLSDGNEKYWLIDWSNINKK